MARDVNETDLSPVLTAARRWIDTCLIADQSVFTTGQLWTPDHIREVRDAFVGHPDTGQDRFIVKLRRQMTTCSAAGQQLMSEMLWALLLFPSSVSVNTKKKQILEIWRLSGADLLDGTGALADDVLKGIGSGGVGFNANRPKELTLLLAAAIDIKELSAAERRKVFSDYDAYINWINTVPQFGNRQFRHMLRYFAFPDRVERMCSNDHRRAVLEALNVGSRADTRQWSDEQLDAALLQLRQRLERQYSGQILDFYESPLKEQWQAMADEEAEEEAEVPAIKPLNQACSLAPSI